jgi:hypothetical protein
MGSYTKMTRAFSFTRTLSYTEGESGEDWEVDRSVGLLYFFKKLSNKRKYRSFASQGPSMEVDVHQPDVRGVCVRESSWV